MSWNSRYSLPDGTPRAVPHDFSYYSKCFVAGVLSCGLTHAGVTPLDVVKCNMQINPGKFNGLIQGLRTIAAEEGASLLFKGFTPTLLGYSAQGFFKFGLNEFFKDFYANLLGQEGTQKNVKLMWACASGTAEFFADIALCPFEMIKVRVQTSEPGTFPTDFKAAYETMNANRGEYGFPFGSLTPLWGRQIPYTIMKFVGFEAVVQFFYENIFTAPRSTYSKGFQLGVTFASGYIAGVMCALISQPADNLVSQKGKASNKGRGFGEIAKEVGVKNLFM